MGKTIGQPVPDTRDPHEAFGYPVTTILLRIDRADKVDVHHLLGDGPPSTNHNNAPNQSTYQDFTNNTLYLKGGTPGGTDGSWNEYAIS